MPEIRRTYGRNSNLTTAEQDIWTFGGIYPWPTTSLPLRVRAGGDAADDIAGAGAQVLLIDGLDDNFEPIQEVLLMAGAAESTPTVQAFRRVQLVLALQAGTYGGTNVGDIVVEDTGGNPLGHVLAGIGVSHMSHYTIPEGRRAEFRAVDLNVPGTRAATLRFKIRREAQLVGPGATAVVTTTEFNEFLGSHVLPWPTEVATLEPKTDLWLSAISSSPAGSDCSAEYQLELWP